MPRISYPTLNGYGQPGPDVRDRFATDDSPKLKFNYFVKFDFRYAAPAANSQGGLNLNSNYLALKQTGRITPIITYADVNYYGFRTKVATRTDFSVFNMTLYDDSANRAHSIIDAYMEAVSPLTTVTDPGLVREQQTIGALQSGSELGVIKEITVKQKSINQDTTYRFYNPKITNIMADELDMTVSDASTISMSFVFDGYNVIKSDTGPDLEPSDDRPSAERGVSVDQNAVDNVSNIA